MKKHFTLLYVIVLCGASAIIGHRCAFFGAWTALGIGLGCPVLYYILDVVLLNRKARRMWQ